MICSFKGCNKVVRSKGVCIGHYQQMAKGQELRPLQKQESMPIINGHKVCTTCRVLKPLEDFYRRKSNTDKRKSQCKACMIAKAIVRQSERRAEQANK